MSYLSLHSFQNIIFKLIVLRSQDLSKYFNVKFKCLCNFMKIIGNLLLKVSGKYRISLHSKNKNMCRNV